MHTNDSSENEQRTLENIQRSPKSKLAPIPERVARVREDTLQANSVESYFQKVVVKQGSSSDYFAGNTEADRGKIGLPQGAQGSKHYLNVASLVEEDQSSL